MSDLTKRLRGVVSHTFFAEVDVYDEVCLGASGEYRLVWEFPVCKKSF